MTNTQKYAWAIKKARNGHKIDEQLLRLRLVRMAETMPLEVLLAVSEVVLAARIDELKSDSERN